MPPFKTFILTMRKELRSPATSTLHPSMPEQMLPVQKWQMPSLLQRVKHQTALWTCDHWKLQRHYRKTKRRVPRDYRVYSTLWSHRINWMLKGFRVVRTVLLTNRQSQAGLRSHSRFALRLQTYLHSYLRETPWMWSSMSWACKFSS